jgi:hypothetical protein
MMLILDANKASDQKIYCFPKCRSDLPFLKVDSSTDLIEKKFCHSVKIYTIAKRHVSLITGTAQRL